MTIVIDTEYTFLTRYGPPPSAVDGLRRAHAGASTAAKHADPP